MTQQYRLASTAAWLSSTGISHHSLLPHVPSTHPCTVNTSPHPGIAPQSPNSSSQPLRLPAVPHSRRGKHGCGKGRLILPFRLPQLSCFSLSLECFSSASDSCPHVGQDPCFSSPPAEGRSSPTNTPVYPPAPSSHRVLRGSLFSFLMVRSSCPLSAGVLLALLCLRVCS